MELFLWRKDVLVDFLLLKVIELLSRLGMNYLKLIGIFSR